MSYITTVSGKHFDPIEPDPRLFDIEDIAHALSLICRANGHFKHFYSVAQHSVACALEAEARGLSREIILGCLLHDASEAYLSDVTRPVKELLPFYLEAEERLQKALWEHFIGRALTEDEKKAVFETDDRMLSAEFYRLMPEPCGDEWKELVRPVDLSRREPEETRRAFIELYEKYNDGKDKDTMKTIYLAGGCFWGAQRFFDQFEGVSETEVGYANGPSDQTDYKAVCASSGHAETVRVRFDESVISVGKLLEYYFMIIDPLSVNKQGEDEGVQYRTGIYYDDESLLPAIREAYEKEQAKYDRPMAVELLPLENFCGAEEYHQKYLVKNPTGYCHVPFWLLNLNKKES